MYRCPDCGTERLLMFSCKTRGFCPSCHAKRREFNRSLLSALCVCGIPRGSHRKRYHSRHHCGDPVIRKDEGAERMEI
ncbi:MAG: transposase zinc-binding domain-containing protein [Candidatus Aminicenantes bacterium]|nr:transposase zinc-binding domain-containing protein [Candidatus Aminicenantes bacterium]HHF52561.1 hypothetical protein [Candidatus Aminicenantes bacterium]